MIVIAGAPSLTIDDLDGGKRRFRIYQLHCISGMTQCPEKGEGKKNKAKDNLPFHTDQLEIAAKVAGV